MCVVRAGMDNMPHCTEGTRALCACMYSIFQAKSPYALLSVDRQRGKSAGVMHVRQFWTACLLTQLRHCRAVMGEASALTCVGNPLKGHVCCVGLTGHCHAALPCQHSAAIHMFVWHRLRASSLAASSRQHTHQHCIHVHDGCS